MEFDIWKTLYTDDFDTNKYLYHYTSISSAMRIIKNNTLLFSQLSRTNDTSESKMKIFFMPDSTISNDEYQKRVKAITEYFENQNRMVQLLCFSRDLKIKSSLLTHIDDKDKYYDVSGRGFAHPRMWAQYADNNHGVCFIIDKKKILAKINRMVDFFKNDAVTYKNFYDMYIIDKKQMDILYERIQMMANGSLTLLNMVQKDKNFLKYNYFEKLDDWENEHEFRILTLIDNRSDINYRLPIKDFDQCVKGIVFGEKTECIDTETIRLFLNEYNWKCDTRKIVFKIHGYRLMQVEKA